jgi:hypothetical protein
VVKAEKASTIFPVSTVFYFDVSLLTYLHIHDEFLAILNEAIPATLKEIEQQTHDAIDSSEKFIAIIETLVTLAQKQLSQDVTKHQIQESMINCRQLELYLNILANDVRHSAHEVEELLNQFKTRLEYLKTTIQNKTA